MNIGSRTRYGLAAILLTASFTLYATDGDVQYSAPYIWVNPETGQVETVNPGPTLKTHPVMEDENVAAEANVMAVAPGEEAGGHEVTHVPIHQILIVVVGIIASIGVMVVMGRSRKTDTENG